ncbi:MAG: SPOR domain-containing protein [Stagnimonas sp.]|nr:SPOR domain-containing protein [Stagnimonas sp.]
MSRPTRDYADRHPRNQARRKPARGSARKKPSRGASSKAGLPAWAWMVVGLSAVLVVAAFFYVSRPAQPMDLAPSTAEKSRPKAIELPPKEPSRFAFYEMLPSYEVVVSDEVLNAPPPKPASRPVSPPASAATEAPAAKPAPAVLPAAAPVSAGPQATPAERVAALQAAVAEEERRRATSKPSPPVQPPAAASDSGERYLIQVAAYRSRADADQQRAALALLGLSAKVEQVTIDQRETWFRVRVGPYSNTASAQAAQRTLQAQGLKGVVMKIKS